MIDFATSSLGNKWQIERNNKRGTDLDESSVAGCNAQCSRGMDTARRLIAERPGFSFAIAFAVGGVLGWLTSKK